MNTKHVPDRQSYKVIITFDDNIAGTVTKYLPKHISDYRGLKSQKLHKVNSKLNLFYLMLIIVNVTSIIKH